MKTAYYMFATQDTVSLNGGLEKAAGEERQALWVRQPEQRSQVRRGGDNVVDLAAWKAQKEQEALEQAGWTDEEETEDELDWQLELDETPAVPVRRPRREHPTLLRGELAATLTVVGATAAMVLRFLAF